MWCQQGVIKQGCWRLPSGPSQQDPLMVLHEPNSELQHTDDFVAVHKLPHLEALRNNDGITRHSI